MKKWAEGERKEYDRKRHASMRDIRIAQKNARLQQIKAWFIELKSSMKCSKCPENHPGCLQFHHRSDDKDWEVGNMVGHGYSKEVILAEIAKCDILCSNCHAKHHWAERQP